MSNERSILIVETSKNEQTSEEFIENKTESENISDEVSNEPKLESEPKKSQTDHEITLEIYPKKEENLESQISFNEKLEKIKKELDEMSPLYLPRRYFDFPVTFDSLNAPESYTSNSNKEKQCLNYIDNFVRQYKLIYKDRKTLLLTPVNEYEVRKYICTYIKPTHIKYAEFYYWDLCAKFISDYLDFVPVVPSTEVPGRILSSSMVLSIRKGSCFEYSNLLCSLLLGVGYNAYVVSGYATRECCYMDQSRSQCPYLNEIITQPIINKKVKVSKYIVKPPKDLKSKFELYGEARKIQQEKLDKEKLLAEQEEELRIKEKPPPDPLFGLRVHCWILIKANSRDIIEDFFVEPLTGSYVPLKTSLYVGIESVWNNLNCWINMQDCSNGINDMIYDFDNRYKWEFILPNQHEIGEPEMLGKTTLFTSKHTEKDLDEEINIHDNLLNVIETPTSWIKRLSLSLVDYEKKYPNNSKEINYYKTKCIRYYPYFNSSGLLMKLLLYSDNSLLELIEEREYYDQRIDKLYLVVKKDGWTSEYFLEGYSFNLKEHHYLTDHPQPESERKLLFHHKNNVDGLERKEETSTSLTEYYVDRMDHLIYLSCTFTKRNISFANEFQPYRNIEKIVKRFSRNFSKLSTEDVAEIILFLTEERIYITYHVDEYNIIPNTREYFKPPIPQDGKNIIPFFNDTHYYFQVNSPCKKEKSKLKVYQYLVELFANEKEVKDAIRWSENQTKDILNQRKADREQSVLTITLFDTIRNTQARKLRIEMETTAEMEKNKRTEDELDYLAPYLYNLNISDIETKEEAFKIREECLMDFKLSLIYKANIIQAKYDEETAKLQKQQQWYYQNQSELLQDDEDKYVEFCTKASFTINNLEAMLNRHKQTAPRKYIDLERKLRNDERMKKFLNAL